MQPHQPGRMVGVRGGRQAFLTEPREAEFWRRGTRVGECLEWSRGRDGYGYGKFSIGKESVTAHRLSAELAGLPVHAGLVLHKCDNPPCFEPEHLYVGSQADNKRDQVVRGRHARGDRSGNAKLTEEEARIVRISTLSTRRLAELLGVTSMQISNIRRGKAWGHLADTN